MFQRFRKETPELQLYGKLPLAKDYLRVGASKGAGRDLREWMDQAFSSRTTRAEASSFAWPARFILGKVDGEPLMGTAWPSSDQGGERVFPFAVFVERRRKAVTASFTSGLAGLTRVWSALSDCHAAQADFSDGQAFLTRMRGRTIEVASLAEKGSSTAARISWEAWTAALWPAGGQEGLIDLLLSLAQLAKEDHRGPIRLPLVPNLPATPQVHGWWSALVALGLAADGELPTAFFPDADGSSEVPTFAMFLRSPLLVEHATWVAAARENEPLGEGDFASPRCALADRNAPTPESAPDLAVSMRGALATARARA